MNWNQRYQDQDIPWDKNAPAPILRWIFSNELNRLGNVESILVPGCGLGHDAAFLAQQGILTTGFDLSETALAQAVELYPSPNLQWVKGDLFTDLSDNSYDLVWEHTCYCAFDPSQREAYVRSMHHTLRPEGQLLGIFLLDNGGDPNEGPPFGTALEELKETFGKQFELEWELEPPVSFPGRENKEHLILWKAR